MVFLLNYFQCKESLVIEKIVANYRRWETRFNFFWKNIIILFNHFKK